MSYFRKRQSLHDLAGMSGMGDVGGLIAQIGKGLSTAIDVSTDPYLGETICRAQQLFAIEHKQAVPFCQTLPDGLPGGIGLRKIMMPLRGFVYAEQHPWVYPVAIGAAVGVPMLIGYLLGKGSR